MRSYAKWPTHTLMSIPHGHCQTLIIINAIAKLSYLHGLFGGNLSDLSLPWQNALNQKTPNFPVFGRMSVETALALKPEYCDREVSAKPAIDPFKL